MDNGFWFDGRHSLRDMGVIAIRDSKRIISAPGETYSYAAGGVHGTVVFSDRQNLSEYNQAVRLYADAFMPSQTDATAMWRKLAAWLTPGRRRLIWDSEPDKYIMAEVTDITGDSTDWTEEGLKITFKCQPVLRSVFPKAARATIADGKVHEIALPVSTMLPAPVEIAIQVAGQAALSGCVLMVQGGAVKFEDLSVKPGERLSIAMEHPAGAEILRTGGQRENALPYCTSFSRLEVSAPAKMQAQLIFAPAGSAGSATVEVSVRGVWR